jgi:formylglycine-generating enzyme required for sulfatase activity
MHLKLCLAVLASGAFAAPYCAAQEIASPATVTVGAGTHLYAPAGEFISGGKSVAAQPLAVNFREPLVIMKYQVQADDYAACVADGACDAPFRNRHNGAGKPVTGVSFKDATDYAQWLREKTGQNWRLPTDAEWSFAAGSKFKGEMMQPPAGSADPSANWIANYERMALDAAAADRQVHELGKFGSNENGLYDLSGNVWEWTSSCYLRASLDAQGARETAAENCGVRVVEGRHRTYMTYFVQDPASGGCSIGSAPDYLGFRLVRKEATVRGWLMGAWERLTN